MLADLLLSLRRMRRHPAMWLIVMLNLTIGLTGVIAAFGVVRAVVLRQLPYPDADRLALIWEDNSKRGVGLTPNSAMNIADVKTGTKSFQNIGLLSETTVTLYGKADTEPVPIKVWRVTSDVFTAASVQPEFGRVLSPADEAPGASRVAVLSYGAWQRRFGGDPAIVGREIVLSGDAHTVIGVMPNAFTLPPAFRALLLGNTLAFGEAELWVSLKTTELPPARRTRAFITLARLTPGATIEQSQSELTVMGRRLAADYPDVNMGLDYRIVPLAQQVFGGVRPVLIVLFIVAVLVLLISMANAIHILLVDLSHRLGELAVRSALGATSLAIVRQLAIANFAACAIATTVALFCSAVILRLAGSATDAGVARLSESTVDTSVLAFTAALAIIVTAATTILTVRHVLGREIARVVREALSGQGAFRRLLLVTHVAIVIAVLAVAGSLTRSWWKLSAVNPGIRPDGVIVLRYVLPQSRYDTPARRIDFQRRLLAAVDSAAGSASGITAAATAEFFPFGEDQGLSNLVIEKRVPRDKNDEPKALSHGVSAAYFQVFGIPLMRGRLFEASDFEAGREPVAIVSDAFVRRYDDGQDMVGRRVKISIADPDKWATIVGVVGSTRGAGLSLPPQPEIIFPYTTASKRPYVNLLVRTAQQPPQPETQPKSQAQRQSPPLSRAAVLSALREVTRRADDQVQATVTDLDEHVMKAIGRSRLYGRVFGILAALAVILGVSGIYGAQSLLVSRKSRDIGVRLCLGAEPDAIIRVLLARFLLTGLLGVAAGIAAAAFAQRQLADVLYGIDAPDWLTIITSALLVIVMGVVATYVPAKQVCRQPLRALLADVDVRASG
jgi:putative ABC transport system permease protein